MKTLKNFKQFGSRIVENQLELPFDDYDLISIRKSLLNKLVGCFHEAYDIAHDLNIHEFEEGDQWLEEFKKWVDTNFPQTERDLPIESFFGTAPSRRFMTSQKKQMEIPFESDENIKVKRDHLRKLIDGFHKTCHLMDDLHIGDWREADEHMSKLEDWVRKNFN